MNPSCLFQQSAGYQNEMYVVQRLFEFKDEILFFLTIQKKENLLSAWSADRFSIRLAYLVDTFRQLNTLNLEIQRKGSLIL